MADSALGEIKETAIVVAQRPHPRLAAAWQGFKPYGKAALYGAAFVGGGLLLAELLGPRTVRRLGHEGGEGFARGIADLNAQIDRVRGDRFG